MLSPSAAVTISLEDTDRKFLVKYQGDSPRIGANAASNISISIGSKNCLLQSFQVFVQLETLGYECTFGKDYFFLESTFQVFICFHELLDTG